MQSSKQSKQCDCGCGASIKDSDFLPGHKNRVYNAIVEHVGDIRILREVVEQYTGKPIIMKTLH